MRALDPLLYEKETLEYFSTLKASWALGKTGQGRPSGPLGGSDIPPTP